MGGTTCPAVLFTPVGATATVTTWGVMISLGKQITAVGCQLKASIVFTKKNLENSEQNCNDVKSFFVNTSFLPAPQALLRRWLMYCLKETKVLRHSLQSTGSAIPALVAEIWLKLLERSWWSRGWR